VLLVPEAQFPIPFQEPNWNWVSIPNSIPRTLIGIESRFRVWMVRILVIGTKCESQSTSNYPFSKPLGFHVSLGESIFWTCCGPPSPKQNSISFFF
jgi:hypothetical protein